MMMSGVRPVERWCYRIAALLFLSGLVHVVVLLVSGQSWLGPVSLRKAATFGLSFGLTLASVAAAAAFVPLRERVRTLLLAPFAAVSVVETTLVTVQAWRGVPSHFNFTTAADSVVSMTLAVGGGVIVLTMLGLSLAVLRAAARVSPSLRLAVLGGFASLLVALAAGAVMIARGVALSRGGQPELAFTTAGSLKPLHFVGMHAVLVLPALAWLLRSTRLGERARLRVVAAATAGYAGLVAVVGYESFADIPPLTAPWLPTVLSGLAVLVLAAAGGLALVRFLRDRPLRSVAGSGPAPSGVR